MDGKEPANPTIMSASCLNMISPITDKIGARICVTGGAGFLGRVVCRMLARAGVTEIFIPRSREFDLRQSDHVKKMFDAAKPDVIIHLAAEVGGIGANGLHPGRFFYANMAMGLHLIEEARRRGLKKFVQVGSVCAYPKNTPVPFREELLWAGFPEETNAPYGVAKRALGVMLEAYRKEYGFNGVYVLPVNLYGPEDNFDPRTSHVIPALIRKCIEAKQRGDKEIVCWGDGSPTREFLYADDAAEGILLATERYDGPEPVNIGSGDEISIKGLTTLIAELTGFHGKIIWDTTKPNGQPRRKLDVTRAREWFGFTAQTRLREGLKATIDWFTAHQMEARGVARSVTPCG